MPNSPKMAWPYPSQDQDPWYDAFASFVEAVDADVFAQSEKQELILHGGGDITLAGSTLSWSQPFYLYTRSNHTVTIPAGSVAIASGWMIYVIVPTALTTHISASFTVGSTAPAGSTVVALRVGSKIVFRNGWSVSDGETALLTGPKPVTEGAEVERFQRGYINQNFSDNTDKGLWTSISGTSAATAGVSASSGWFPDYLGNDRWFIHYDTTATSGSHSGIKDLFVGRAWYARITKPVCTFHIRTGSSITDTAINIGLSDGGWTEGGLGLDTEPMLRFRYSTVALDTVWKVQCGNGTLLSTAGTSATVAANTSYCFKIDSTVAGSVKFYIDDTLVHTATSNLPSDTAGMTFFLQITTKSAAVRSFKIGSPLLVEHDL